MKKHWYKKTRTWWMENSYTRRYPLCMGPVIFYGSYAKNKEEITCKNCIRILKGRSRKK